MHRTMVELIKLKPVYRDLPIFIPRFCQICSCNEIEIEDLKGRRSMRCNVQQHDIFGDQAQSIEQVSEQGYQYNLEHEDIQVFRLI